MEHVHKLGFLALSHCAVLVINRQAFIRYTILKDTLRRIFLIFTYYKLVKDNIFARKLYYMISYS